MIKSGRARINYLRSDRRRYRSSALVVDVMGSMGRAHKPPRILWTTRFGRSTRSHSVGPQETLSCSAYGSLWPIVALAVLRSSDVCDLAQPQWLVYFESRDS
jgi:hypothetical protein